MAHVSRINAVEKLIQTNTPVMPHQQALLKYPFEYFNKIQSAAYPYCTSDVNVVVACSTSAGKTVVAETFMSDSIWRGQTAIYMAPLRAVVAEKYDDWTTKNYGFALYAKAKQLNVSILTGDFRLTKERQQELYQAHLIALTPEMMDSRTRRMQMEMNAWLNRVGTLCVDEIHLLGLEDRGHRLESALMRFSSMNKCRIIGLSATMPNVEEVGEWLSNLNGKPTLLLESDWRPVKLVKKIVKVQVGSVNPEKKSRDLVSAALSHYHQNRNDKTIFFVHTKKMGKLMLEALKANNVLSAFHSGSATLAERQTIETAFRHDQNFKALVSTSTLAYGMNLPARRVNILGVNRGREYVHPYDIAQMQGRAGRNGLDAEGEANLFLTSDTFTSDVQKYSENALPPIESHFRQDDKDAEDDGVLAFHIVSETVESPKSIDQLLGWYERSFANATGKTLSKDEMVKCCDKLESIGVFFKVGEYYQSTNLGKIASWMYLSPLDVVDMMMNWKRVFANRCENESTAIAFALFNTHTCREDRQYVPVPYDLMQEWQRDLDSKLSALKLDVKSSPMMCLYEKFVSGHIEGVPAEAIHMLSNHRQDMDRILTACELIDKMAGHWGQKLYWRMLSSRVMMGVPAQQAELCMVKGIGAAISKQLVQYGVSSIDDLVNPIYERIVAHVLKGKYAATVKDAREILSEMKNENNA